MKTNWLKQNLLMIIGSVIVLGLMGTIIWFVRQADIRKRQVESDLESAQQQIERLRASKPFPSSENIRELQNDSEKLQRLYIALQEAVTRKALAVPPLRNEVDFVGFLRKYQRDLRAAAKEARIELPEGFSFGFGRYDKAFPCRIPPLRDQDCRQLLNNLAKQMLVVDKVTRVAYASGISHLLAIRRLDLEAGQTDGDALPPVAPSNPLALFRSLPVEIKFGCNEAGLRNFLNNIAQTEEFLVVRNVSLETETYTVTPTVPTGLPVAGFDVAEPTAPQQEIRQRLVATARVEWVEFQTEPPAAAPGGAPGDQN